MDGCTVRTMDMMNVFPVILRRVAFPTGSPERSMVARDILRQVSDGHRLLSSSNVSSNDRGVAQRKGWALRKALSIALRILKSALLPCPDFVGLFSLVCLGVCLGTKTRNKTDM